MEKKTIQNKNFKTISTNDPNALGEYYRDQFFVQYKDGEYIGKGCYAVFDLHPNCETIPDELVDEEWDDLKWTVVAREINGERVVMKYYWDGDGILDFHFPDGSFLHNSDCKKDYVWEWGDDLTYAF
jgi:hypothetical protein